jgi:orotidine-5'-phosphate decarboxylase
MTPVTGFADRLNALPTTADRLCVGIDPHPGILADWGLPDSPEGITRFARAVLDTASTHGIQLLKPQVAFFERHGVAGMAALADTIGRAREAGLVVIADAKRGDVGSTVAAYASAWLEPGGDFESDAVTTVAFQGVGSIEPMCEAALHYNKGLFVLVNTSNPEGWVLQGARVGGAETVSQYLLNGLIEREQRSPRRGWLGAVIGATLTAETRSVTVPGDMPLWILAPGFGHQGASLSDVSALFGDASSRVIPTVSRSIVSNGPGSVADAIAAHRAELAP